MTRHKELNPEARQDLLTVLKNRFETHIERHRSLDWRHIQQKLEQNPEKLWSLYMMEETGGEPDVVSLNRSSGEYLFFDCSPETPEGRRSLCYDREALESRKKYKPEHNAVDMAADFGIELLSEDEYLELQKFGPFDTKTSSWLKTPDKIRAQGGALFGDCRFGRVFIYHNGAESYFAARGFRGVLRV